jgi:hypothetical protein
MKKIILIFLFLGHHFIFSQKNIYYGFKGGINKSQIIGDENHGYYKTGFNGGLLSNLLLNRQWTIQFEILFNDKGCHYNYKDVKNNYISDPYQVRLYYLEAPILLQYNQKNFFYEIGLELGYLIDSREYILNESLHNNVYPFSSTEKGFNVGLGYFFTKKAGINLRYNNSIYSIRTVPSIQYNSVFMLTLIYRISLHNDI